MPNQHFRVSIISRGGGRSAVATAAYDSGSKLEAAAPSAPAKNKPHKPSSTVASAAYMSGDALRDERAGKTFDYRLKEDVLHTEILAPPQAPEWVFDRQTLWNNLEAVEKRKDARLARSIIAALPRELSTEQNLELVRDFVQEQFVSRGMIADFALHDKEAADRGRNPHVHIMLTLREITLDGFGKKNREWDGWETKEQKDARGARGELHILEQWRHHWEEVTNRHLEAAGQEERISLKSYEEQGINKTPQMHMGHYANDQERQGEQTHKGNENREIKQRNAVREVLTDAAPPRWQAEPLPPQEAAMPNLSAEAMQHYQVVYGFLGEVEQASEKSVAGPWEMVESSASPAPPDRLEWADEAARRHHRIVGDLMRDTGSGAARRAMGLIERVSVMTMHKARQWGKEMIGRVSSWAQRETERRDMRGMERG